MSDFLDDFQPYDDCVPPGVRLPKIEIEDKYYRMLEVTKGISNFDFLRKLCHKGVKDRGIDEFSNKTEYLKHIILCLISLSCKLIKGSYNSKRRCCNFLNFTLIHFIQE